MKPNITSMHAIILAGGKSRRMGQDKASMWHPSGMTMARRMVELLQNSGLKHISLSLRHDQMMPTGIEAIQDQLTILRDDPEQSQGPISGIMKGIELMPTHDLLVVACDLPRLEIATMQLLLDDYTCEPSKCIHAYASEWDGLPEPLCAIYRTASFPLIQTALEQSIFCPRKIIMQAGVSLIQLKHIQALANTNTPEDWEQVIEQIELHHNA